MAGSPDIGQQFQYLKQTFLGFMKAKEASEMHQLGLVLCTILEMSPEEQITINDSIIRITAGNSSIESLTYNIASIWGFR